MGDEIQDGSVSGHRPADSAEAVGVHCLHAAEEDGLPVISVGDHLQARLLAAVSGKVADLPADETWTLGFVLLTWLPAISGHVAFLAAIHA